MSPIPHDAQVRRISWVVGSGRSETRFNGSSYRSAVTIDPLLPLFPKYQYHTAWYVLARGCGRIKACCVKKGSRNRLYLFVLVHVIFAKPLHTFARHALAVLLCPKTKTRPLRRVRDAVSAKEIT